MNQFTTLHSPPPMWRQFRQSMLQARRHNEEVIGFFFCKRHHLSKRHLRLLPKAWIVPSPDCYESQSVSGLVLKQEFHLHLLKTYLLDGGLDIVHIHTHPGGTTPHFSPIDDYHEGQYAAFLSSCFRRKPRLISGVFDESLEKCQFRIWNRKGSSFTPLDFRKSWFISINEPTNISSSSQAEKGLLLTQEERLCQSTQQGKDLLPTQQSHRPQNALEEKDLLPTQETHKSQNSVLPLEKGELEGVNNHQGVKAPTDKGQYQDESNCVDVNSPIIPQLCHVQNPHMASPQPSAQLMFARQRVFGERVQQHLGELTIAVIGCGGIGAVFTEQLARLGVKKWVLVDPDRLETVNLNRLPGATPTMVEQRWHKVGYVKWLIKRIYERGSVVRTFPTGIEDEFTQSEIAAADLLVVATDNHFSRQVAQELALEYQRPLVCLGTHIEVQPYRQPRMYCRVTVPPLGGEWCLMCGNIINLHQAALESAPREITDMASQAGYLEGVEAPAVFWLNSICASTGVGVIHGLVSGFLDLDAGLDWIYEFPRSQWLKTNTQHLETTSCYFCSQVI